MSDVDVGANDPEVPQPEVVAFSRHCPHPDLGMLSVRGELDISTSGMLERELGDLLESGAERLEVDLSGVVFIDSSALSALVGARERATRRGLQLVLVSPSPACEKVLGITGLDRVFDTIR